MRLKKMRLQHFRCFEEEFAIEFEENITAIVGKNDVGKSSIMEALAIFFGKEKPDPNDANINSDSSDVRIICEFDDLPCEVIIDNNYKTALEEEYLLNISGDFEVHQVWNCSLKNPKMNIYAHALHPSKENHDDLLLLPINNLKARADFLGVDISQVDKRASSEIRKAIWNHTSDLELAMQSVPLSEEYGKKIWDQISRELPEFALFKSDRPSTDKDAEAQDPMKAAVDEAIRKLGEDLSRIEEQVRNEVVVTAKRTVEKIREMDPELARGLNPQFEKPNWRNVFKISLTDDEEIPINKRGSGVRRMILLNFFRAKAEQSLEQREEDRELAGGSIGIIYCIEELETCQHPNSQKLLLDAFTELTVNVGCQVILTTHSPMFARMLPVSSLRYLSFEKGKRVLHSGDDTTHQEEILRLISDSLGVLADHSVALFIGVEGKNDINFLKQISRVLTDAGEDCLDLVLMEEKGRIIFVPVGGSNIALWVSRLMKLNRSEYYIIDKDVENKAKSNLAIMNEINELKNCKAVLTSKREMENYLHPKAIQLALGDRLKGQIDNNIINKAMDEFKDSYSDNTDIPREIAEIVYELSKKQDGVEWSDLSEKSKESKISKAKGWLNDAAVQKMTPNMLDEIDVNNDIRSWLSYISKVVQQGE